MRRKRNLVGVVVTVLIGSSLAWWPGAAAAVGPADLVGVVYYETEFDDGNLDPATQGPASGMQGLQDVVATPDGKHVYVSGSINGAIARFSRDPATGLLTYLGETIHNPPGGPHLEAIRKMAVSPDSKHLYTASVVSSAVSVFTRVEATGDLVFVQSLIDDQGGVTGLGGAKAAAVSPDGRQVYVAGFADDAIAVFDRDATTGVLTHSQALFDGVGGVDGLDSVDGVIVSPDGKHVYAVSGKSLPNLTQGDDAVAVFARDTDPISPTFGELMFVEALFDGVGGVNGLHEVQNVDISPDGRHVYTAAETDAAIGTDPDDDWLAVFSRDATTGRLTFVEAHNSVDRPECGITFQSSSTADVKVDPAGVFVYATDPRENTLVEFVRSFTNGTLGNQKATCKGAKRNGSDFENESLGGMLTPVALAITGAHVYVGGFSPAAVNVFGPPSVIEIGKDAVPDDPQDFEFEIRYEDPVLGTVTFPLPPIDDDTDPTNPFNPLPVGPLEPGVYEVVEKQTAGWFVDGIGCTDPSGGTTVDVPSRTASVGLGLGETVNCTFTNLAAGTIRIRKDARPDAPTVFGFTGLPDPTGQFFLDDDLASPLPDTATFADLAPGTYSVVEEPVPGWSLGGITCTDPDAGTAVSLLGRTATIDLDAHETVECTFTNDSAAITIRKFAGPGAVFDFTGLPNAGDSFQLDDDSSTPLAQRRTFSGLAPGAYPVEEIATAGWELTGISCIDPDGGTTVDVAAGRASIDLDGGEHVVCTFTNEERPDAAAPEQFGLHDVPRALWNLPNPGGDAQFFYGNPGDLGFMGDWDCDGVDTVGVYRDGRVYLRNANSPGIADLVYPLGNPGDVALAGDFDGNGCDTVSLYRPSQARFYVFNGLRDGTAASVYTFGNPGDVPFAGDFDGDGIDTFGVHRPRTGEVFLRNAHAAGAADVAFTWGDPGDLVAFGDWDGDGDATPGLVRRPAPAEHHVYIRNVNTAGIGVRIETLPNPGLHRPLVGVFFAP